MHRLLRIILFCSHLESVCVTPFTQRNTCMHRKEKSEKKCMENYEMLLSINETMRKNIEKITSSGKMETINKCISFTDDLDLWISYCNILKNWPLVKEAQDECLKSIIMCTQGFYKEAIIALRQCLEHMLFAILLSTNDYKYRLWQRGQCDMSWTQIVDDQNGIFGKQFISTYANDIDTGRSLELLTIAKNVYRECSEFVHGNYEKLNTLTKHMNFSEEAVEKYADYFFSVQYIISWSLLIRFRDVLNEPPILIALESVLMENLGTQPEIQALYGKDLEELHE